MSAHEIKSIPEYKLIAPPKATRKFPRIIPVDYVTAGRVIVPAPNVATINEKIEAKNPPY